MLNISVNLETGVARLAQTTSIKAGGGVPVRVTFSSNPGDSPAIELALAPESSAASVLAYLDDFEAENTTTFLGTLDANDTRLIEHLTGKDQQTLALELVVATAGSPRRPFPNVALTVQAPKIVGPQSTEGGPVYLTQSQSDARYLQVGRILTLELTASMDNVEVDLTPLGLGAAPTALLASVATRGAVITATPNLLTLTPTSVTVMLSSSPGAPGAVLTLLVIP